MQTWEFVLAVLLFAAVIGVALYFLVFHNGGSNGSSAVTLSQVNSGIYSVAQVTNNTPAAPPPSGQTFIDGLYTITDSNAAGSSAPNGMIIQLQNGEFQYTGGVTGTFLIVNNQFSMVLSQGNTRVVLPMTSSMQFTDPVSNQSIQLGVWRQKLPDSRCPINYSPSNTPFCSWQDWMPSQTAQQTMQPFSNNISQDGCTNACMANPQCQAVAWETGPNKQPGMGKCEMIQLAPGSFWNSPIQAGKTSILFARTTPVTIPEGAAVPVPYTTFPNGQSEYVSS